MFKIGDKVVCVDDTDLDPDFVPLLENKIYTIRGFNESIFQPGIVGVLLVEIQNDIHKIVKDEYSYNINRFRKLEPPEEQPAEIQESLETEALV